jgi:hypothetical protein
MSTSIETIEIEVGRHNISTVLKTENSAFESTTGALLLTTKKLYPLGAHLDPKTPLLGCNPNTEICLAYMRQDIFHRKSR